MSVRKSVDALKDDLNQVRGDLLVLTQELGSVAHAGGQEAKERLLARITVLQSRASVLQEHIRQAMDDGMDRLDDHVHNKPYQTAIVAGVLGGLIAWLVTRPRD